MRPPNRLVGRPRGRRRPPCTPVPGMSANGFEAVIDIDVPGTFNTCRAAHQFLRKCPGSDRGAVPCLRRTKACGVWRHRKRPTRKVEQTIPLRRFGGKDELADLALFLLPGRRVLYYRRRLELRWRPCADTARFHARPINTRRESQFRYQP